MVFQKKIPGLGKWVILDPDLKCALKAPDPLWRLKRGQVTYENYISI